MTLSNSGGISKEKHDPANDIIEQKDSENKSNIPMDTSVNSNKRNPNLEDEANNKVSESNKSPYFLIMIGTIATGIAFLMLLLVLRKKKE
jgi:hypothetical protein